MTNGLWDEIIDQLGVLVTGIKISGFEDSQAAALVTRRNNETGWAWNQTTDSADGRRIHTRVFLSHLVQEVSLWFEITIEVTSAHHVPGAGWYSDYAVAEKMWACRVGVHKFNIDLYPWYRLEQQLQDFSRDALAMRIRKELVRAS